MSTTLAPRTKPDEFKDYIGTQISRFSQALPKHLTAERIVSQLSLAVARTPKLQECSKFSICMSALRASSLGLELEPSLGEAYLIPRWNSRLQLPNGKTGGMECTFLPGFRGLRKLALQTGRVAIFEAHIVYEGDEFDYEFTPELAFRHKPAKPHMRGPIVQVYSRAKLDSGEWSIEVMTVEEIEKVHQNSEGYKYAKKEGKPETGPWVDWTEEMYKKTTTRRHSKALPASPELSGALTDWDRFHQGEPVQAPSLPLRPRPSPALVETPPLDDEDFLGTLTEQGSEG